MDDPAPAVARAYTPDAPVVPRARSGDTLAQVRRGLDGVRFDSVAAVVVLGDDDRVIGILRPEELFAADAAATVGAVMDADAPRVHPGDDEVAFAWEAVRRGESCLPMVDDDGRLLGLVTPRQLMRELLAEHEQDMSRMGGVLHDTVVARAASYERVSRRLWHRLPWLLFGLLGAFLSAAIVGGFEDRLSRNLTLAFFVPAVVYMADAVGTQTETLMVRGLSVGVAIRPVLRRELTTGVAIGLILAVIAYPAVAVLWGDRAVAGTVALSLLAACSTATVVAMTLPAMLERLGFDPAFGSGPLATVIQDLSSIAIYFAIATALGG